MKRRKKKKQEGKKNKSIVVEIIGGANASFDGLSGLIWQHHSCI